MNRTNNYFTKGLWIFAFQVVCIVAAVAVGLQFVIFIGIIINIILSLGLLILLMQANKELDKSVQEFVRLKQREHDKLKQEQQSTDDNWQQVEAFKVDEALARIMPDAGTLGNAAAYTEKLLKNIAKELDIVQGLVFLLKDTDQLFHVSGEYAYFSEERPRSFPIGETISGQVAKNQKILNLKEIPEGYITVLSGLGKSTPRQLIIVPIVHEGESIGIMELASFKPFGENEVALARKICESMADLLNELRK